MKIKRQFNNPVETFNYLMEYNIDTSEDSDTEFHNNANEIIFNIEESNLNVNKVMRVYTEKDKFIAKITKRGTNYKLTYIDLENLIEISHTYTTVSKAFDELYYIVSNKGVNYYVD